MQFNLHILAICYWLAQHCYPSR